MGRVPHVALRWLGLQRAGRWHGKALGLGELSLVSGGWICLLTEDSWRPCHGF